MKREEIVIELKFFVLFAMFAICFAYLLKLSKSHAEAINLLNKNVVRICSHTKNCEVTTE